MTLAEADLEVSYKIDKLDTQDEDLERFLLSLGLFTGEKISLVSMSKKSMNIVVRDVRYTVDRSLAEAILLEC